MPDALGFTLFPYSPIPLFPYSPIPLFPYSPPLFPYSPIPLFPYSPIPLFPYSPIPLFPYSPIPLFPYSPDQTRAVKRARMASSLSKSIFLLTKSSQPASRALARTSGVSSPENAMMGVDFVAGNSRRRRVAS